MYFTTIATLVASLALTSALPLSPPLNTASLTFHGAAGAQYTLSVPLDGSTTSTNNALSISSISTDGFDVQNNCKIHAVDYTPALVVSSYSFTDQLLSFSYSCTTLPFFLSHVMLSCPTQRKTMSFIHKLDSDRLNSKGHQIHGKSDHLKRSSISPVQAEVLLRVK